MTVKLLIAIALSGTLLTFCTGCATRQLPTAPMSKEQIQLERERIVATREANNQRWLRIGEFAGTTIIDVVGNWLKSKTQSGLKK